MKYSHYNFYPDARSEFVSYKRTIHPHEFSTKFTKLALCDNQTQDSSEIKEITNPSSEPALSENFQKNFSSHHETEQSRSDFPSTTASKSFDSFQSTQSLALFSPNTDSNSFIQSESTQSEGSYHSESPLEGSKASKKENRSKTAEIQNQEINFFWSREEDNLLLKLAVQLEYDWKNIAKQFDNKKVTTTFVRTRYQKLTDAQEQSRVKFHLSEDVMLAKYFEKYGFNWVKIAEHFKNRTPIMLKNRYYSYIRKKNLLESLIQKARELEGSDDKKKEHENQDLKINVHLSDNVGYNIAPNKFQISSNYQNSPETDFGSSQKFPSRIFYHNQDFKCSVLEIQNNTIGCPLRTGISNNLNNTKRSDLESLKKEVELIKLFCLQAKSELSELRAKIN